MSTTQAAAASTIADLIDGDDDLWQTVANTIIESREAGQGGGETTDSIIDSLREAAIRP